MNRNLDRLNQSVGVPGDSGVGARILGERAAKGVTGNEHGVNLSQTQQEPLGRGAVVSGSDYTVNLSSV